jgi:hypothetical protein
MHFKANKNPTNTLIFQCVGIQYSPTCFGTLKYYHQGVKHDSAERGAPIVLCFPRHWAPLSRIMFDSLMIAF